jgi:hypothetical protein
MYGMPSGARYDTAVFLNEDKSKHGLDSKRIFRACHLRSVRVNVKASRRCCLSDPRGSACCNNDAFRDRNQLRSAWPSLVDVRHKGRIFIASFALARHVGGWEPLSLRSCYVSFAMVRPILQFVEKLRSISD